jgi:2-polyprenyl-3-methyl-5-hydroxy-6-metoxy-1,4-benzoquinol methylase
MNSQTIIELNQGQQISEHDSFTPARYLSFLRHFPPGTEDVLDIGCNTGRGGAVMKSQLPGLRITGLDCVPERLGQVDANVYKSAICGFSHEIPLRDGSFDAIVAGEIIEHVPPQHVFPTLCEWFRLLRLRGRVLLTTPNPKYLKNYIKGLSVMTDPSHVSQHTPASMKRRLEDVGFSRIRMYGNGRVSRIVGPYCPSFSIYGSYLTVASKW